MILLLPRVAKVGILATVHFALINTAHMLAGHPGGVAEHLADVPGTAP